MAAAGGRSSPTGGSPAASGFGEVADGSSSRRSRGAAGGRGSVDGGGRRSSVVGLETLPLTKAGQAAVNTILGGLEGEFLVSLGMYDTQLQTLDICRR